MRCASLQIRELKTEYRIDDVTLVERVKEKDIWAIEVFYRRFVNKISGIAAKLLRNSTDIEDVVQETFIQAYRDINQLREPRYLERWLVRIAIHRVHHRFRIRRIKRKLGLDRSLDDERLCDQASVAATQEARAELALLDSAFDVLDITDRSCFVLHFLEGYRLEEVAGTVGCSLATVKRRIAKAKRVVNRHFKEGGRG